MLTRTLTYIRSHADAAFVTTGGTSAMLSLYQTIVTARASATGFQGETTTTSEDGLTMSHVETWATAADYDAFYSANQANVNEWDTYKNQYNALNNIGMVDAHVGE
jgi:hypothetical protein